jgi:hypothetical protein
MPRKKTRTTIHVPDGAEGMTRLSDRRFDKGPWLDTREIASPEADVWLQHLSLECRRHGLRCAGISQIDAKENSGSYTICPSGPDPQPELVIVWERKRDGPLRVNARVVGTPPFDPLLAVSLLDETTRLCQAGITERFYCAGYIEYNGLAWRGEHWLGCEVRLGPPPKEYELALFGPRAVLVEALVAGLDILDARATFQVQLRELAAFLGVALRMGFDVPTTSPREAWVSEMDVSGRMQFDVRQLGYQVPPPRDRLPDRDLERGAPVFEVARPSLEERTAADTEQNVPADLDELWSRFSHLAPERRQQFLRVATLWQLSNTLVGEFETASVAYLVAACEALKPNDAGRRVNAYDVVEALLGKPLADKLRSTSQPQNIRHKHFHAGELHGREFTKLMMMESYRDPSFRLTFNEMWLVTAACIVEWLRKDGLIVMATPPRNAWVRVLRRRTPLALCVAIGLGLGWLLRAAIA